MACLRGCSDDSIRIACTCREEQLQHALAEARGESSAAQFELQEMYTALQHMQQEVESAEAAAARHAADAEAAQAALAVEAKRREEAVRQLQQQLQTVREDHEATLAQQQPLLDALAQRDTKVRWQTASWGSLQGLLSQTMQQTDACTPSSSKMEALFVRASSRLFIMPCLLAYSCHLPLHSSFTSIKEQQACCSLHVYAPCSE